MTDIFNEIDEDVRRARYEQLWKKHGGKLILLVLAIVIGFAGWQFWQYRQRVDAQAAAARYTEALALIRDGKPAEAEPILEEAARSGHAGYETLARFRLAAELGRKQASEGIAAYDALAATPGLNPILSGLARLRAALLAFETATPDDLRLRLTPLTGQDNAWRHPALELLGLSALKAGDMEAAGRAFDQLVVDPQTPQGLRARVQLYLDLVRAGPVKPAQ